LNECGKKDLANGKKSAERGENVTPVDYGGANRLCDYEGTIYTPAHKLRSQQGEKGEGRVDWRIGGWGQKIDR
jgi:hypothetical protein